MTGSASLTSKAQTHSELIPKRKFSQILEIASSAKARTASVAHVTCIDLFIFYLRRHPSRPLYDLSLEENAKRYVDML